MKRPSERGGYQSPYTSVVVVDGAMFLVTDRERGAFRAMKLTSAECKPVTQALDAAHADVEAPIVGARRQRSA